MTTDSAVVSDNITVTVAEEVDNSTLAPTPTAPPTKREILLWALMEIKSPSFNATIMEFITEYDNWQLEVGSLYASQVLLRALYFPKAILSHSYGEPEIEYYWWKKITWALVLPVLSLFLSKSDYELSIIEHIITRARFSIPKTVHLPRPPYLKMTT